MEVAPSPLKPLQTMYWSPCPRQIFQALMRPVVCTMEVLGGRHFTASVSLSIALDCYNLGLYTWAPLLEECNVQARVVAESQSAGPRGRAIPVFEAKLLPDVVLINVTEAMVRMALHAAQFIESLRGSRGAEPLRDGAPGQVPGHCCVLDNRTAQHIRVLTAEGRAAVYVPAGHHSRLDVTPGDIVAGHLQIAALPGGAVVPQEGDAPPDERLPAVTVDILEQGKARLLLANRPVMVEVWAILLA